VKPLARAAGILGIAGVAYLLFSEGPKDVVLVYDVSAAPEATALEIEIRRREALVRRSEFRLAPSAGRQVRHELRLPAGDYALAWWIATPAGGQKGERALEIRDSSTVIVALSP